MSNLFIPYLQAVGRGEKLKRDLSYEEAKDALRLILRREASDVQAGAFLIAQRVKGEAVDEINGMVDVMREEFMVRIRPQVENLLDIACPYNGKNRTAQLAPAVAFTLVAAGIPVVLHGGEGVPTKPGITPGAVLWELSIPTHLTARHVQHQIEKVGFGFFDMAQYSPSWVSLLPMRRQFGLRTVCNTIEKLFNPADAPYQISGFFHANYIERIRSTQTGTQQSWMIKGEEGSIETAAGRRTPIYGSLAGDTLTLSPKDVGLAERERIEVEPTPAKHAAINIDVINGVSAPATDQVALTAGTILSLLGVCSSVPAGYDQAKQLLVTGRVNKTYQKIASG